MNPFIEALQFFGIVAGILVGVLGFALPFLVGWLWPDLLESIGNWIYLIWPVTTYLGVVGAIAINRAVL